MWFDSLAQRKEMDRRKDLPNYRNDPTSFSYGTTAAGLPKCSYYATFTSPSGPALEYYLRVAGTESYAMFIFGGSPEEIESVRKDIDRMADTVQLP
jgi:hypothetical protein